MEVEPVKIHPPEGFEVCPTSTQTEIRFRPISKSKPKWEDFGNIEGYFVVGDSQIRGHCGTAKLEHRNIWPTKEEAEACLALSQLCQWRDKYNEGWNFKYNGVRVAYILKKVQGEIVAHDTITSPSVLSFNTAKIRDKFLEDFSELIETARPLL